MKQIGKQLVAYLLDPVWERSKKLKVEERIPFVTRSVDLFPFRRQFQPAPRDCCCEMRLGDSPSHLIHHHLAEMGVDGIWKLWGGPYQPDPRPQMPYDDLMEPRVQEACFY